MRNRVPLVIEDLFDDRMARRLRDRQRPIDRRARQGQDQHGFRRFPGGAGRRDLLVGSIRALGLECEKPRATFYVWTKVPRGHTSVSFTERVLKEAGVAITPGSGFGKGGEGYVRFSLTVSSERLVEAVDRLKALRL